MVLPVYGISQPQIHTGDGPSAWAFQRCYERNKVDHHNGYDFFFNSRKVINIFLKLLQFIGAPYINN